MKEIKGQLTAGKSNYAIVVSRFNEFITSKLLDGAKEARGLTVIIDVFRAFSVLSQCLNVLDCDTRTVQSRWKRVTLKNPCHFSVQGKRITPATPPLNGL